MRIEAPHMQNHAMLAELGIIALLAIPFIVSFATNKRWRKRRRLLEIDRCSDDEAPPCARHARAAGDPRAVHG